MFLISGATWGGITVEEGAAISTIGRGKPAYDSSTGLVYAAGRTGVLGLSNGTINLLPATPEMAQGPGYINIGACGGACTGAATTLAAEGTCWSPPTAPSRWPTMRAMVRATCCWRCPR